MVCRGIFWHFRMLEGSDLKGWQNYECLNMYIMNTNDMESALYGINARVVDVSETSLVCYVHSFDF